MTLPWEQPGKGGPSVLAGVIWGGGHGLESHLCRRGPGGTMMTQGPPPCSPSFAPHPSPWHQGFAPAVLQAPKGETEAPFSGSPPCTDLGGGVVCWEGIQVSTAPPPLPPGSPPTGLLTFGQVPYPLPGPRAPIASPLSHRSVPNCPPPPAPPRCPGPGGGGGARGHPPTHTLLSHQPGRLGSPSPPLFPVPQFPSPSPV